ncbi:hypothetical protein PROFUN_16884 [Planoprotostelium fungivorum]|uniref:Uncharacterized protein n=1 Tax=Planoprotostelium fungivorum TaxID=1890364 RepID=A0A2P6MNJ7_9EUKA|nr:hypothetical protein PROFUN_16884 [Planoprotostelium fungivorum]
MPIFVNPLPCYQDLSASTKHCRLLKAQDTEHIRGKKCELNEESDNSKGII